MCSQLLILLTIIDLLLDLKINYYLFLKTYLYTHKWVNKDTRKIKYAM